MLIKAHGKINLSLDIVGKREDGYHLLEMVMQSLSLHDEVVITQIEKGIELTCNKSYVPEDERNIAYKAAKLILEEKAIDKGVNIEIIKNIPVSAGLGGGSSNAAAVLQGINSLFNLEMEKEELMAMGLELGADVPYFFEGGTALVKGIGEEIIPLNPFKDQTILLIKPSFGVSTKEAYGLFSLDKVKRHVETNELIHALENVDYQRISYFQRNLLENVVLRKYPILKNIKKTLKRYGASSALMSGSGPTIYGIFENENAAENAATALDKGGNTVILTKTI